MAIRPDYNIGTVSLVASSANFTTTGASLQTAAVQAGDAIITPSGHVLIIASITGQNSGTLFLPCPAGAAGANLPLRIRFQPDGSRYQGAVRNLVDLLSSGNIEAFAALIGEDGLVPIFTGVGTMDLADPATFGVPDPNDSLAKLAELTLGNRQILQTDGAGNLTTLTLAARQVLQTDANGALKVLALVANKFLRTDENGDLALSDLGAAAIALLNLSGTAAADRMPYLTGASAAGLTTLTAFARTVLDDTSGGAMLATMGALFTNSSNGRILLPIGGANFILQWMQLGNANIDFVQGWTNAFPTDCLFAGVNCEEPPPNSTVANYMWASEKSRTNVTIRRRQITNGGGVTGALLAGKAWGIGY